MDKELEELARKTLAEVSRNKRVLDPFDDVRCYLAPNQVLPAMLAFAAALKEPIGQVGEEG